MFDATLMGNNAVPCAEGVGINYPFQAAIGLNFSTPRLKKDKVLKNFILPLSD